MKRSEMIDMIYEELKEILEMRQYSNEEDEKYYKRRSNQILEMIEGFGMSPPEYLEPSILALPGTVENDKGEKCWVVNGWEPEDA